MSEEISDRENRIAIMDDERLSETLADKREISDRENRIAIMGFILMVAFVIGYYVIRLLPYFH
jgi:hypothetical protein